MPSVVPVSAQSRRFTRLAVLIGCGIAVAGCNGTIETVRSLRGIAKNDPDPATAPFTGNMEAAEAAPYPNLASVPPPPSRATTAADRQKLTEKLVAERAAMQAAGGVSGTAPPANGAAPAPAAASGSPPATASPAKASPAAAPEVAAPNA